MRDPRAQHQRREPAQIERLRQQRQPGRLEPVVPHRDIGPEGGQAPRHRQPVPPEADDRIPLARKDRVERHRIFNVASPTSASTIDTIQNRITIVGSDQPFFS